MCTRFGDRAEADSAPQIDMPELPTSSTVAPQVFYLAPHDRWYLIYQWGARYSTNDDIANPNAWEPTSAMARGRARPALDFWVICDDANCHLFFSRDDDVLYRSKVSIDDFPISAATTS